MWKRKELVRIVAKLERIEGTWTGCQNWKWEGRASYQIKASLQSDKVFERNVSEWELTDQIAWNRKTQQEAKRTTTSWGDRQKGGINDNFINRIN